MTHDSLDMTPDSLDVIEIQQSDLVARNDVLYTDTSDSMDVVMSQESESNSLLQLPQYEFLDNEDSVFVEMCDVESTPINSSDECQTYLMGNSHELITNYFENTESSHNHRQVPDTDSNHLLTMKQYAQHCLKCMNEEFDLIVSTIPVSEVLQMDEFMLSEAIQNFRSKFHRTNTESFHQRSTVEIDAILSQDSRPCVDANAATEAVATEPPALNVLTTIFCPELNCRVSGKLSMLLRDKGKKIINFKEFKERLCKVTKFNEVLCADTTQRNHYTDRVVVAKVDDDGWCTDVGDDSADYSDSVRYSRLTEGDTLEVRRFGVAFVGGKYRLASIAASERYNQSLQEKVSTLSKDYTGFRKIRGDGNCYYRAVFYGLIEFIITSGQRELFQDIIDPFTKLDFIRPVLLQSHQAMLTKLNDAKDGNLWHDMAEFNAELLNESTGLDESLIRACKKLVASILVSNEETVYNELTVRDAILFTFDDVGSVKEFCNKYIIAMGVCAEGVHVNLGLLPSALGCNCNIVILPREKDSRIATIESRCGDDHTANIYTLNLLLRPGHYDLLYTEDKRGVVPVRVAADPPVQVSSDAPSLRPSTSPGATCMNVHDTEESLLCAQSNCIADSRVDTSQPETPSATDAFGESALLKRVAEAVIPVEVLSEHMAAVSSVRMTEVEQISAALHVSDSTAENLLNHYGTVQNVISSCVTDSEWEKTNSVASVVKQTPPLVRDESSGSILSTTSLVTTELTSPYSTSDYLLIQSYASNQNELTNTHPVSTRAEERKHDLIQRDSTSDKIDSLVNILSVSRPVASRLLSRYGPDVDEVVTQYFGLSERQQKAFEEDHIVTKSNVNKSNADKGNPWGNDDNKVAVQEMLYTKVTNKKNQNKQNNKAKNQQQQHKLVEEKYIQNADRDRPTSVLLSPHQSSVNTLSQSANDEFIVNYCVICPDLNNPDKLRILKLLVNFANVDVHFAVTILRHYDCWNVYACLYFIRIQEMHLFDTSHPLLVSKDVRNSVTDHELCSLIKQLTDSGFNRNEVLDAIVFDYCVDIDDILDSFQSCGVSDGNDHTVIMSDGDLYTKVYRKSVITLEQSDIRQIFTTKSGDWGASALIFGKQKHCIPDPHEINSLGRTAIVEFLKSESAIVVNQYTISTRRLKKLMSDHMLSTYERV